MSAVSAPQTFSSREVIDLLDVTYRQLDHWANKGWIPGLTAWPGSGKSGYRRWTLEQVAAARVVRDHLDQARALRADPSRCQRCPCRGGGS